ncbi:MAG: hypothetical protein HQL11_05555 [Candidatus Omnitrophica bacterium]|nr:hypothetical protein [Candidatus Omnitrophota bacterium]
MIRTLVRLGRRWSDPRSEFRVRAARILRAEAGYPEGMTDMILGRFFGKLTASALRELQSKLRRHPVLGRSGDWAAVLPGNVPDPLLLSVVWAVAAGKKICLKMSTRQRCFGEWVARSLKCEFGDLCEGLEWTASQNVFYRRAKTAGAVFAYGSDATIREVRRSAGPRTGFIGFGHALSAGVVFRGQTVGSGLARTARLAATEMWLYDQKGCLSPQFFLVEGEAGRFAEALAGELHALDASLGRVRRTQEESVRRRIGLARLDAMTLGRRPRLARIGTGTGPSAAVYVLKSGVFPCPVGHQVALAASFQNLRQIKRLLAPHQSYLHCIGIAGTPRERAQVRHTFAVTQTPRLCPLGRMQTPPTGPGNIEMGDSPKNPL